MRSFCSESDKQEDEIRRRTMVKTPTIRRRKIKDVFFIVLIFTVLLIPTGALAFQRDGNIFFFSFEELKEGLIHLTPVAPLPRLSWLRSQPQAEQESLSERNYRWGDGLGIDGYAHPWVRQPLWGY